MKALSIKQPWAWAIVRKGKDVENRKWRTHFRGNFLIHASKTEANNAPEELTKEWREAFNSGDEAAKMGGIIGVVELTNCMENYPSKWAMSGLYHFVLKEPVQLPFRQLKGSLSFFEVNND